MNKDIWTKPLCYLLLVMQYILLGSCAKYLEVKPDKKLVVPQDLQSLQAMMDNNTIMNIFSGGLGEASSDNYYLTDQDWSSLHAEGDKNIYLWKDHIIFEGYPNPNYWAPLYQAVYYANVVLENLAKIDRTVQNVGNYDQIKGSALFFRARCFHVIATNWAVQYQTSSASEDLGIPLRLSSDFNIPSTRATNETTYQQIIHDLQDAISLLPVTPTHVMRPSKPAAYALLSRVYLSMNNYQKAGEYADSALMFNNQLIDYNNLDSTARYPFTRFNEEVFFHAAVYNELTNYKRAKIDTNLISAYDSSDLRRKLFFSQNTDGSFFFRGSYDGSSSLFCGLATDELYLTKAECLARNNQVKEAMNMLNNLLIRRYEQGYFTPFKAVDAKEALHIILDERRKELLMRDLRWMDLKRLNTDPSTAQTLQRKIGTENYVLSPGSPRYALPIPDFVIDITGMQQNPR